jgi:preprotein translocase subunit SecB
MAEAINAGFSFDKFRIPVFSYSEAKKKEVTLGIEIVPKGVFNKGNFDLELNFKAFDNDDRSHTVISITFIATFQFDEGLSFEDIPGFFYKNSIAIAFPYIRAFISTLTLQANTGLIILGLMNLTNLEDELIDNTSEISE